jgi:serine/threonine protein kinase
LNAGRALIGRTIAGRYRVLALVGEGGMGAVYVAEHLMIGRKVALKRLHPELASDEKAVARFQREARAAAATGHEHIVEVIDLGFGEDGAPFLVMEYLRGRSLSEVLRMDGTLEPRRACRIVGQVLTALGAVHRRGIVHRDLKPDNVFLTQKRNDADFVKVVDFGISKMQKDEGENAMALTRTGVMLGTPFYMSPEQARGMKDLDHRVDLYGAGVMLYECLTGRVPFEGENYHQLLQHILSGKHRPARELAPAVSAELAAVLDRAIAADPAKRYASAREMLLALVPHGAIDPGASMESDPPPFLFDEDEPTLNAQGPNLGETTPWSKQKQEGLEATVRVASPSPREAPLREAPVREAPVREGSAPRPMIELPSRVPADIAPRLPEREAARPESAPRASSPEIAPPRLEPRSAVVSPPARPASTPEPAPAATPVKAKPRVGTPRGLAPEPAALYAAPRRFVAQSSDWDDRLRDLRTTPRREEPSPRRDEARRDEARRDEARRDEPRRDEPSDPSLRRRDGLRRASTAPELEPEVTPGDVPDGETTRVKGAFVFVVVEQLKLRSGVFERVLARLPPSLGTQLLGVVLPMAWFSLGEYVDLLRSAERELGIADGTFAVRMGRLTADRELTTTHRLFMQTATPATAVDRIPQIFRTYHRPGRARVLPNPAGGFRVDVDGLVPDALPHALALSGFYHRMLELAGAQEVRSAVVSCRERGDETTVTALRWR